GSPGGRRAPALYPQAVADGRALGASSAPRRTGMAHRPARGPHSLRARPARAAVVPAGDDANAPLRCRGLVGRRATAFDRIDLVAIDGRAGGARPGLW